MKTITFLIVILLATGLSSSTAQNTWTQKADFGGTGRNQAVGFSIGNKGYIGTGNDYNNLYKDFWEYDPTADSWTQKANFGGGARYSAVGFSIGNKGYAGTGLDSNFQDKKDFWEYDPITNTWSEKANFGGIERHVAVGFSIGSKGYIGTGFHSGYKNDFWEYDPNTNTWTQKADFSGTARDGAIGFSIGSKGYLGAGYDNQIKKDFYEYDPLTNTWNKKANLGNFGTSNGVGFSIGNKGYISYGYSKDFWEYDPDVNIWIQKADFEGEIRSQAVGFSIGNKGYIGTGVVFKDFWEYTSDEIVPACTIATNLSADNVTSSTATLNWDAVNGAISYQLLYKAAGTSQWSFIRSSTNQITLSELSPNTDYTCKVKSVCSISPFITSEESALRFTTAQLRLAPETNKSLVNVFPNPFINSTTLSISSSDDAQAVIELFDLAGRKLRTIIDENLTAGNHKVILNRLQLNSGIYLLQVKLNDQLEVKKLAVE